MRLALEAPHYDCLEVFGHLAVYSPERRRLMIEEQIRQRGVTDPRVIAAMAKVPRERYVPAEQVRRAYDDGPLPIG